MGSYIFNMLGMLIVPVGAEEAGMDTVKVPAQGYPDGIAQSAPPAE